MNPARSLSSMTELRRLRRAGGDALHLLVDLLPDDWDPRAGTENTSVVFADIADYSEFVAEHGDDAALSVLDDLDEAVAEALTAGRSARVVKRLGDGLMITARRPFEAPAVATALAGAFRRRMRDGDRPLRLRAGVHRGPCRRQGFDYFGYHVNLAARVAETAPPGRVLCTGEALDGVDLQRLGLGASPAGRLDAKGVVSAVDLFHVFVHPGTDHAAATNRGS